MNRKTIAALSLSLLLLSGCGAAGPERAAQEEPDTSGANVSETESAVPEPEPKTEPETETAVLPEPEPLPETTAARLDAVSSRCGAAGVQAAVIRDGKLAYVYSYGTADRENGIPVSSDTKFRCASLSKPVVAIVALRVAENGGFDLDADIGACLGYDVRSPRYPDIPITPRMLMTHTSSLMDGSAFLESRNSGSSVPLQKLLAGGGAFSGAKPGTQYSYSNFGVAVLAAALEKQTGKPFYQLAKEMLFEPLGIDAGFLASELSEPGLLAALYWPGGGTGMSVARQLEEKACETLGQTHHLYQGNLTVSAADYAKILCLLLNGGESSGVRILSPESVREMLEPNTFGGTTCGLCLDILPSALRGKQAYCHTGSNFGMYASFAVDPASRSGAVVFTSGAHTSLGADGLYTVCSEIITVCCEA